MPEHDLAAADPERRHRRLAGAVARVIRPLGEREGRSHLVALDGLLHDLAAAGKPGVEGECLSVPGDRHPATALDHDDLVGEEIRRRLVVPAVDCPAPALDDRRRIGRRAAAAPPEGSGKGREEQEKHG